MDSRRAPALRVLGALIAASALLHLPPMAIAFVLEEDTVLPFFEGMLAALVVGLLLWLPHRRTKREIRLRDGFMIVTLTWAVAGLILAIPFMTAPPHLDFTDAVFEAVSGLTTTGATMITGLDDLPRSVLIYRQSLNFVGGMGIVILAVAILPMLRVGGMQLFRAESTGPTKDSRLTPRIAETAKALWSVYLGLTLLCALAYWLAGMDLFDAVAHSLSTTATGGFSTYDASFGHWDSALVDSVGTLFMLLGGINFGLHYMAWRRASMAPYSGESELRTYLWIAAAITAAVAVPLWAYGVFGAGNALRHAAFQTVSNMTTTGFATTGFVDWPAHVPLLLVMASFVGGCAGSTSGGMKVARVSMAVRQGLREVLQLVHPRGQFMVKMGGRRVSERIVLSVGGFCGLYLLAFLFMTLVLTATGVDLVTAFSAVVACINNLGPGLGEVASNFQTMGDSGVWVCSFAMILGRLEVFTVLVLFLPQYWKE